MERGSMVLRHGITVRPDKKRECMHFDMDRFVTEHIDIAEIPALVETFVADIYDLFMSAVEPDLLDWLNGAGAQGA